MSLFQIKTYADEFLTALAGHAAPAPAAQDDTVPLVAAEIEDQTQDFVLKRLSQDLKGTPLEEFIAQLLQVMGYKARLIPTNEPSVDLIAHKDELGLEPPIIRIQVKSGDGKTVDRDVSALYGKVGPGEYGLLIALGSFTPPAIQFAGTKSNLRLIDGTELVNLIFEHYDKLDSRFKSLIPLKRVLWLATKLRRDPALTNPTIVVVTDRTQLDQQIARTFERCGFPSPERADRSRPERKAAQRRRARRANDRDPPTYRARCEREVAARS